MEYFWDTGFTIPDGQGFAHYGAGHLLWLAALAASCAVLIPLYRRWDEKKRLFCLRVTAALLVADELFKYAVTVSHGNFRLDYLPLHLCSINIFVIVADAVRPSDVLRDELYAVCLPGAFFALAFPGWSNLPIKNALCIHSFTYHILLFLYPLLILCGGFKPRFKRFARCLPVCAAVVAAVYFFNRKFGTNFMFLRYPGSGNPLTWFESKLGRPGYIVGIPIIAGACWLLLYGVPALYRKWRR